MATSSLWTDMDTGVGLWENIPSAIRQGFRAVLASLQNESNVKEEIHTSMLDIESDLRKRIEELTNSQSRLEGALRKSITDLSAATEKIHQLERYGAAEQLPASSLSSFVVSPC